MLHSTPWYMMDVDAYTDAGIYSSRVVVPFSSMHCTCVRLVFVAYDGMLLRFVVTLVHVMPEAVDQIRSSNH